MNRINKIKYNFFVLVTVPHSVCPKTPQKPNKHPCDYRAAEVAEILKQILETNGIPYLIIKSRVLRSVVDMNRDIKPETPYDGGKEWAFFNNQIQTAIDYNSNKNILLLDLHSFDKINSFCKEKKQNNCFITILDIFGEKRSELYTFAAFVSNILKFKVYVTNGGTNYIINTYNKNNFNGKNVYPMLLEFFEDRTLTNDNIKTFLNYLLSDMFISNIFR